MSFQVKGNTEFLNLKLTGLGRQLLSLGLFRPRRITLEDKEIDYSLAEPYQGVVFDFDTSPVFITPDNVPFREPKNIDGGPPIDLSDEEITLRKFTESTEYNDFGFFYSGTSGSDDIYLIDTSLCIATGTTNTSSVDGTNILEYDTLESPDPVRLIDNYGYYRIIFPVSNATITTRIVDGDSLYVTYPGGGVSIDPLIVFTANPVLNNHVQLINTATTTIAFWLQNFVIPAIESNAYINNNFYVEREGNFKIVLNSLNPSIQTAVGGSSFKVLFSGSAFPTAVQFDGASGAIEYGGNNPILNVSDKLILIQFHGDTSASPTPPLSDSNYATQNLWYRIKTTGTTTLELDRNVPDISSGTTPINFYIYPWDGIYSYYNSGQTTVSGIWNLNIVRTSPEVGSTGSTDHISYGSIDFNGTKKYFGFNQEQRMVGFVHFSNNYTGNTYNDYWEISATTLNIPTIMWHRKPEYRRGKATLAGHSFTDQRSLQYTDPLNGLRYSILYDGVDNNRIGVGRVYQDLKTIVITDPELLTAITYKSNRNWTMPPLELSLRDYPSYPYTLQNSTGLCQSDKIYAVTYKAITNRPYDGISTFGLQPHMHCEYIKTIQLSPDATSNKFLVANLDGDLFPYLRGTNQITSYSGTGWNANQINLLVKEIDSSSYSGISSISHSGWTIVSGTGQYNSVSTYLPDGNNEDTLSPSGLSSYQMIVNRADFLSGGTYSLDDDFYSNNNPALSGLTFGNESFFYGNLTFNTIKSRYKITIKKSFKDYELNKTINPSFEQSINDSVYLTSVNIYDDYNRLIGMAKPTSPIRKADYKHLELIMEIII